MKSKFNRMMDNLSNADIALIRKAEAAGLTTFSQGVKSLNNDYDATVAQWNAALNPAPAVEEAEEAEDFGEPDYDSIDEYAIEKRAVALANDRGFLTAANVLLTDADEIEAYLLELEREKIRARHEEYVRANS